MMVRRVIAVGAALGVALIPAAASASVSTVYTKSYAGYSANFSTTNGEYRLIDATAYLPALAPLAKVTNGVTTEIRVNSSVGQWDMQLGANPQTQTAYHVKMEHGSTVIGCFGTGLDENPPSYPQQDQVSLEVAINCESNDYPGIIFTVSDSAGNNTWCGVRTSTSWPGPSYGKLFFVGGFNPKSYHAPTSSVLLAKFMNISIQAAASGTITSYPHSKYVATSTGTATGVKRAVPSGLDSTGSAFTVSIP